MQRSSIANKCHRVSHEPRSVLASLFPYPRSSRLPFTRAAPPISANTPAARWWCSDILDHRVSPYASGPTYICEHPAARWWCSDILDHRVSPLRERPHLYLRTPAARWWYSGMLDHRVSPYASGPTYICEHPQRAGDVQIS